MNSEYTPRPVRDSIRQSLPVDLSKPYDIAWLKGKHVLITGGASGFGAEFARTWAKAGATIVIADINAQKGAEVVASIRKETDSDGVYFIECNVADWQSQVRMFREAVGLSSHGGIDVVVANAGIAGPEPFHDPTSDFGIDEPKKPDYRVIEVNLIGVLYTSQLALWYLQRNPGSKDCSPDVDPSTNARDRHLLLVGSIASLAPIVTQPLYGASKHAVLGLFRTLRGSAYIEGIRANIIFPYFIETPIISAPARLVLAGGGMGRIEDVVDAASRLTADSSISGRGLCIGPKVKVKQNAGGDWNVVPQSGDGEEVAVWEAYADDWEDTELFTHRMVKILNQLVRLRGWMGTLRDAYRAVRYGIVGR